jgi:hypothetical protein
LPELFLSFLFWPVPGGQRKLVEECIPSKTMAAMVVREKGGS